MFKPLQLSDSATAVSLLDPAIDWDKMIADAKASDSEHFDGCATCDAEIKARLVTDLRAEARQSPSVVAGKIAIKSGFSLTKFVIGVIPADHMVRIADECTMAGKYTESAWRCFLASVRDIEGFEPKPKRGRMVGGVEYCDTDWLKSTFVRGLRTIACEIGGYAWSWNQLTEDETKN